MWPLGGRIKYAWLHRGWYEKLFVCTSLSLSLSLSVVGGVIQWKHLPRVVTFVIHFASFKILARGRALPPQHAREVESRARIFVKNLSDYPAGTPPTEPPLPPPRALFALNFARARCTAAVSAWIRCGCPGRARCVLLSEEEREKGSQTLLLLEDSTAASGHLVRDRMRR